MGMAASGMNPLLSAPPAYARDRTNATSAVSDSVMTAGSR